ncbi:serine hydrolase domain-containing protein [Undibacterium sp. TJN19]|uniref:serine hydrolase domain-containing protein n=1 Tax=Undibacterium sp. TJN19 TaxID=3413055 RepID=UPI003BF26319
MKTFIRLPHLLISYLLSGALTLATPVHAQDAAAHFPGSTWEDLPVSALKAECSQSLQTLDTELHKGHTTSLFAARGGRVLFSYGAVDKTSVIESARKSILSMLYGKYVANGTIDLEQNLAAAGIDDIGGLSTLEKQARIRDLLTARSGIYHPASNSGDDTQYAPPRDSQKPGSYFLYNNWDFNAAGAVLENATHQNIYRLFDHDIAATLQLQDFRLQDQKKLGDKNKSQYMAYHFTLSTRDMARLGQLALHQGNWRGQQLIPADWMALTTHTVTPSSDMHPASAVARKIGYGYLWWVLEEPADSALHGAYMAWGLHGQYILVIPKADMVIAHQRQVPVDGNWDMPKVDKNTFIHLAKMLIDHCQQ